MIGCLHSRSNLLPLPQCLKLMTLSVFGTFGVPGAIRTRGVPLRRRTLYPAEVRRLIKFYALSAEPWV